MSKDSLTSSSAALDASERISVTPKTLDELVKLLESKKSSMSEEDYKAITSRITEQKDRVSGKIPATIDIHDPIVVERDNGWVIKREVAAIESAMRKEKARKIAADTAAIQAPAQDAAKSGDPKAVADLAAVEKDAAAIDAEKKRAADVIKKETQVKVKNAKDVTKTEIKNTLPEQAKQLIAYLEAAYPKLKGSDIVKQMKGESGIEQKGGAHFNNPDFAQSNYTTASLEDVNVRGLIEHLVKGVPYVSDGYYGPRETAMVERIIEEFGKNSEFKTAILSVAPILSSGSTAELALRDMKRVEKTPVTTDKIISFLSALHANAGDKMDGLGAVTRVSGKNIESTLRKAEREGRLLQYLNNAIALSGRIDSLEISGNDKEGKPFSISKKTPVSFASLDDFATALNKDVGLKYSVIDGMNYLWMSKELPGLKEGVSDNEKLMLQKISGKVKEAFDTARENALKNSATPEDRKAVSEAFAHLQSRIERPDIQYSVGAMATNQWIGGGAGFEKWLNDKNSLVGNVGLAGGKLVLELAIPHEFSRTETTRTSGKVGVMGGPGVIVPFGELSHQKNQWTAALRATPVGGWVTVDKELGNDRQIQNWMEIFKQSNPELADQLLRFSDPKTKVSDIAFSKKLPEFDKDQLAQYKAVSDDINAMIRRVLVLKKFDTIQDPAERYSLLFRTMTTVVQDRQDRIRRDAATNGVSLTNAGVALGAFAGIPFITPWVSFGANTLEYTDKTERRVSGSKSLDMKEFETRYLAKTPEVSYNSDGSIGSVTYSIKPDALKVGNETVVIGKDAPVSMDSKGNTVTFRWKPRISIQDGVLHASVVGAFDAPTKTPPLAMGAKIAEVQETRSKISPALSNYLYNVVGHSSEPVFKDLVAKLARQDFDGARKVVESLQKTKYKTLAKEMLAAWGNVDSFVTHMYGSKASRSRQEYTQQYVDARIRTSDVVRAETRLAASLGITKSADEKSFRIAPNEKYVSATTASLFPGQEMTVSCFSTPKGGLHRVDTYDASVSISKNNYVKISDAEYKRQIVDATLKSTANSRWIEAQLSKLNNFLKSSGSKATIDLPKYAEYLVTGDIAKLGVPDLKVIKGKEPSFFEGRAMIAGNVCINRLHGIVYPLFELGGNTQVASPLPQIEETTTQEEIVGGDAKSSVVRMGLAVGFTGNDSHDSSSSNNGNSGPTTKPGGEVFEGPLGTPNVQVGWGTQIPTGVKPGGSWSSNAFGL